MGGLFGGGPPSPPKPPPPPPEPKEDTAALEALARKRKALDRQRAGISSLVIPKESASSGLRIIE